MARRLRDVALAVAALLLLSPILAAAAIGIRWTSPGPVLYRCRRVGRGGTEFTLYKFRTMHVHTAGRGSPITARHDTRIFAWGHWLRRTKIDELPQLFNVLIGDMAIVGPRPEDPGIVRRHYTAVQMQTLQVRPGLASPGSIYNYTHGERLLGEGGDTEHTYVTELLPVKLSLDLAYVRHASLWYDMRIVGRTIVVIVGMLTGRQNFPLPPEMRSI
ncbi:MAG: sugar transferase [Luteitalea sp.]|nr:sugar transferase [Luteitalea sp.]